MEMGLANRQSFDMAGGDSRIGSTGCPLGYRSEPVIEAFEGGGG